MASQSKGLGKSSGKGSKPSGSDGQNSPPVSKRKAKAQNFWDRVKSKRTNKGQGNKWWW